MGKLELALRRSFESFKFQFGHFVLSTTTSGLQGLGACWGALYHNFLTEPQGKVFVSNIRLLHPKPKTSAASSGRRKLSAAYSFPYRNACRNSSSNLYDTIRRTKRLFQVAHMEAGVESRLWPLEIRSCYSKRTMALNSVLQSTWFFAPNYGLGVG